MKKAAVTPLNKDNVLLSFGAGVRVRRDERELTQEQLAERSEMHVTYISQIERGLKNLSLFNIHRLAMALEVHPTELFRSR